VVLNVSTTFGPEDYGPSAHGGLIAATARGKVPIYVRNQAMEVVPIEDAARAFLLAEERGRPGERYIISEKMMSSRDILTTAAEAVGVAPPRFGVPLTVMKGVGIAGDLLSHVLRRDMVMTRVSVRLMHCMTPVDHAKATRELGWEPGATEDGIRAAAKFFVDNPTVGTRH
jgi:dihydroflavonol-4-reductase